ncbi:MAG: HD domain-containing phosphohydrolase [Capsulimonadaceae bacterium]
MRDTQSRLLLVARNEGTYTRISSLVSTMRRPSYSLEWTNTYDEARQYIDSSAHEIWLVDTDLGPHNGLELIYEATRRKAGLAAILLTDEGDEGLESALQAGAADSLVLNHLDHLQFARSLRYAIDRKQTDDALYLREQEFKALVENSPDIVARYDRQLRCIYINPAIEAVLETAPHAFLGKTLRDLKLSSDIVSAWEPRLRAVFDTGLEMQIENPVPGPLGVRYFHSRFVPEPGPDGYVRFVLQVARDVTQRHGIEEQLKLRDRAIQSAGDGVVIVDVRQVGTPIVYVNPAWERITGYSAVDLVGCSAAVLEQNVRNPEVIETLVRSVRQGKEAGVVCRLTRRDGIEYWSDVHVDPINEGDELSHCVAIMRDITKSKNLEIEHERLLAEAIELVERDPLTSLLNHRAFHKRLALEAERANRENTAMAVVFLNVKNFRYLNDAYGHVCGDEILRLVANTLRSRSHAPDLLARTGGDEYAVILDAPHTKSVETIEHDFAETMDDVDYCPPGSPSCVPISLYVGAAFLHEAGSLRGMLQEAESRIRRSRSGGDKQSRLSRNLRNRLSRSISGFAMLDALVTAVDTKDRYTRRHSEDVMVYCLMIADEVGLNTQIRQQLAAAALLHDVGKTGVPDLILRKPGALTEEEYEIVKQHPMMGAAIISAVPGLEYTLDCVRHHHERWDGLGYPFGLIAEECPPLARLMAVADAMSAMTTDRPYRKALSIAEAVSRLRAGHGSQWDPLYVDAMLLALEKRRYALAER